MTAAKTVLSCVAFMVVSVFCVKCTLNFEKESKLDNSKDFDQNIVIPALELTEGAVKFPVQFITENTSDGVKSDSEETGTDVLKTWSKKRFILKEEFHHPPQRLNHKRVIRQNSPVYPKQPTKTAHRNNVNTYRSSPNAQNDFGVTRNNYSPPGYPSYSSGVRPTSYGINIQQPYYNNPVSSRPPIQAPNSQYPYSMRPTTLNPHNKYYQGPSLQKTTTGLYPSYNTLNTTRYIYPNAPNPSAPPYNSYAANGQHPPHYPQYPLPGSTHNRMNSSYPHSTGNPLYFSGVQNTSPTSNPFYPIRSRNSMNVTRPAGNPTYPGANQGGMNFGNVQPTNNNYYPYNPNIPNSQTFNNRSNPQPQNNLPHYNTQNRFPPYNPNSPFNSVTSSTAVPSNLHSPYNNNNNKWRQQSQGYGKNVFNSNQHLNRTMNQNSAYDPLGDVLFQNPNTKNSPHTPSLPTGSYTQNRNPSQISNNSSSSPNQYNRGPENNNLFYPSKNNGPIYDPRKNPPGQFSYPQ